MSCHNNCPQDSTAIKNHNDKIINNEVRVSSSLYTNHKSKMNVQLFQTNLASTNNWKTKGPMKNGSYARHLAKKTAVYGSKILSENQSDCC
jgi:hypothetical protein